MKNQYFGDVNDYRKYGLLRGLAGDGCLSIGDCWMLTPNDHRPDGEKTEYLDTANCQKFEHFDPSLYEFLRRKVHGHETEDCSRDVRNFNGEQLRNGHFWDEFRLDNELTAFTDSGYTYSFWTPHVLFFLKLDSLQGKVTALDIEKGALRLSVKNQRDRIKGTFSVMLHPTMLESLGREIEVFGNISYRNGQPQSISIQQAKILDAD